MNIKILYKILYFLSKKGKRKIFNLCGQLHYFQIIYIKWNIIETEDNKHQQQHH